MVKQNASIDASFWVNTCAGEVIQYVLDYFQLFAPIVVADEIRYPLMTLKLKSQ